MIATTLEQTTSAAPLVFMGVALVIVLVFFWGVLTIKERRAKRRGWR